MRLVIQRGPESWFGGDSGDPVELEPLGEVREPKHALFRDLGPSLLCRTSRTITSADVLGIWDGKTRYFDHVLLRDWPTSPGEVEWSSVITPVLQGAPIEEIVETGFIGGEWTHASIKESVRCID